jgi:hypothetical protein
MTNKQFTGIQRASVFSPNHIGNDAAIFSGVAGYITEKGYDVSVISELEFLSGTIMPERVFTMMRNRSSIKRLQQWEREGCIAVNSAFGIENCERERLTKLFIEHNIPYPESIIVNSHEKVVPLLQQLNYSSYWLKRSDFHAIHREDVSYARHPEEVQGMLAEYALRGIDRVVINEHLEGDLIKFYGVAGSPFFYWFYPFDKNHSKFGYEKINGKAKGIHFDEEQLRYICRKAAETLHLIVYGGDCIVSPNGTIYIIDFNDWPSFAPCRKEAIPAIGDVIIKQLRIES